MTHIRLCVCIVAAALALGSCSKLATIRLRDGRVLEARISTRDPTYLHVHKGVIEDYRVPCKEIASIDHPGQTAAIITTAVTAVLLPLGIYAFAAGIPWNGAEGMGDTSPAVIYSGFAALPISVVTGIAAIWNWSIYSGSVNAAKP